MKSSTQESTTVKVTVYLGIYLLRVLDAIPWIWGNMAVYVTSYYYAKGDTYSGGLTNWLISLNGIGFNLGVLIADFIVRRIGIRTTLGISLFIFNSCVLLGFLTIKHSFIFFLITFGFLTGLTGGIIQACQLSIIVRWTDHMYGLTTSSAASSNIMGSVALNLLLTLFINPSNETPDAIKDNDVKYFTQIDIIERVPYAFLSYGVLSSCLSFLGLIIIRERPGKENMIQEWLSRLKGWSLEKTSLVRETTNSSFQNDNDVIMTSQDGDHVDDKDESKTISEDVKDSDVTPRHVFKRCEFYALCLFLWMQSYAFFIINTYYKEFGLIYIPDDHFLTVVAMVKCFGTPFCAWMTGYTVDKFGVKVTTVVITSFFCALASLFYLTPGNKWLYMFACVAFGCALFSLFCTTSTLCVKLFGKSHFTTILGMVLTSSILPTICYPYLATWIISSYGWFPLFFLCGVFSLFSVISIIWAFPEITKL